MKILNVALVTLALVACDGGGDSTTTLEPRNPPSLPSKPSVPGVFEEGTTYSTTCLSGQLELAGMKVPTSRKTYFEQEGRFIRTDLLYVTEKRCESEVVVITESGAAIETDANERDLTYETTTVLLKNDLAVAAFNQAQICGFTDWELNIEKDISNGTAPCFTGVRPRSEHQVFVIEEDRLYFGESSRKIDKRIAYTK